ncbi:hypothetical protein E2C01_075935 [Portunus trituberculatus]|uniref:Uncharacterized protein n=1 Tax=Portunus trituberculatus TaxID=210409 RepID=A0A5B7IKQ1_PORTR|nr:hypothetical protein [Portunus trituberculatus]
MMLAEYWCVVRGVRVFVVHQCGVAGRAAVSPSVACPRQTCGGACLESTASYVDQYVEDMERDH